MNLAVVDSYRRACTAAATPRALFGRPRAVTALVDRTHEAHRGARLILAGLMDGVVKTRNLKHRHFPKPIIWTEIVILLCHPYTISSHTGQSALVGYKDELVEIHDIAKRAAAGPDAILHAPSACQLVAIVTSLSPRSSGDPARIRHRHALRLGIISASSSTRICMGRGGSQVAGRADCARQATQSTLVLLVCRGASRRGENKPIMRAPCAHVRPTPYFPLQAHHSPSPFLSFRHHYSRCSAKSAFHHYTHRPGPPQHARVRHLTPHQSCPQHYKQHPGVSRLWASTRPDRSPTPGG